MFRCGEYPLYYTENEFPILQFDNVLQLLCNYIYFKVYLVTVSTSDYSE
jgi:hypothetical protein